MFLPQDEPSDGHQLHKSLQHLGESIQALLGSKKDLTFRWAESVRFIIEDLSAVSASSESSPRSPVRNEQIGEQEREKLEEDIAKLEAELLKLRTFLREEDARRSDLLNKYLDLKGNVRVFCRVRPLLDNERSGPLLTPGLDKVLVPAAGKRKAFQLDKVFLPASSQDDVFAEIDPLIKSALDGHNVCIFAYGQTGSGKTFTMEGTKECPGVVPRALQFLFHQASLDSSLNFHFTFSMLEVYMGNLRDLLVPAPRRITDTSPKCLSIQMDVDGHVEVENLTEYIISDIKQASQLYRIGSRARSTARTNSNEASSRSHCLIRVTVSSTRRPHQCPVVSKLWLIDLGGSERLMKTRAKGQILEEGKAINLSLTSLADVISALQKRQPHIPYRNSKLTQILRDSLGEDAKTVLLVHVSPKEDDTGETICSLSFATRARGIHLGKELSGRAKEEKAQAMEDVMQRLQKHESSCQYLRDNIQELEFLCRKKKEMLNIGKHEGERLAPRVLMLSQPSTRNIEKKERSTVWLERRPRFMTATTCSRMKERSETNNATLRLAGKVEKMTTQVQRRCSAGDKNRAAKISPVDYSPEAEQLTDAKQCGIVSGCDASETKTLYHLSVSNPKNSSLYTNHKITPVLENAWNPQGHCHTLEKVQDLKYQTGKQRSSFNSRRFTFECSGQIMINTTFDD